MALRLDVGDRRQVRRLRRRQPPLQQPAPVEAVEEGVLLDVVGARRRLVADALGRVVEELADQPLASFVTEDENVKA